eukprot:gene1616-1956_t
MAAGLRAIRTDISLDMGQYAGRASSRAALFDEGGINGNGSSSSSSDEQESSGSQQQQAAPGQLFTAEVVGVRALTPGTLLYQPSDSDQRRHHLDRAGGGPPADPPLPPDSQPADEELHSRPRHGQQHDAVVAAADGAGAAIDVVAGMSAVLGDDEGMLQLEREAAAVRAEAAQQLLEAAERGSKDASKAAGVRAQKRLWGSALEMRIRLQRLVTGANILPRPQQQAALAAADPQIAASAWAAVDGAISGLAGFRDASLDKWHRRTVLSSGTAALRGSSGLRALQQSVSNQVSALMRDKQKLISRTQLPRQLAPRPLGQPPAAAEQAEDDAGDAGAGSSGRSKGRDVDTFDEGDFYQQLLKELIESAPLGSLPADHLTARPAKRRKVVDRRASKGRKIRYHTMEKLVNFMAPADLVTPPFAEQLFANLFSNEGE